MEVNDEAMATVALELVVVAELSVPDVVLLGILLVLVVPVVLTRALVLVLMLLEVDFDVVVEVDVENLENSESDDDADSAGTYDRRTSTRGTNSTRASSRG